MVCWSWLILTHENQLLKFLGILRNSEQEWLLNTVIIKNYINLQCYTKKKVIYSKCIDSYFKKNFTIVHDLKVIYVFGVFMVEILYNGVLLCTSSMFSDITPVTGGNIYTTEICKH